jgi:hypothetical protein
MCSDLDTLQGEAVGVAGSVTLDKSVTPEFAQIIAKLIKTVTFIGEMEGGEDGLVDLIGSPTSDMSVAMEENLTQADDASIVDFDSGIADRADGDGQSNPLQERKVDVDIRVSRAVHKIPSFPSPDTALPIASR